MTRPLELVPLEGTANAKRVIADEVDLKALGRNLRAAEAVVNTAESLCNDRILYFADAAIEFPGNDTEIVFTTDEYIALAKQALAEAAQRAESETLLPECSVVNETVLESHPAWERALLDRAFQLGRLVDPAVRREVKKAKLVVGFDVSKGFKGTIFFGRAYFQDLMEKKAKIPVDEIVSFTCHSEINGHLNLAAAVKVLKGTCDLL